MPVSLRFAVVVALVLAACGDPCARLSTALCDGGAPDTCVKVDEWLQGRLIDPETKDPLQGEARTQMCTAIYGSVDIFNAYRFKAKQKVLGEPDFTMKSSTPAANRADPDPKPVTPAKASLPPAVATPPVVDEPKADEAKGEKSNAEAEAEGIKQDERPGDGEEEKPAANMSD